MPTNRIDAAEALGLLQYAPLLEVMARADAIRREWHPRNEVTFVMDTNPNYTNVCVTDCTFCSFYRRPGQEGGYTLTPEQVAEKVAVAQRQGATTVLLQGGHHPGLTMDYFLSLIECIRHRAPGIHLHLFSPTEIAHMASLTGTSPEAVLEILHERGLRTMPGGGAEILVDRVRRKISPKKISADAWLNIMRSAHRIGFKTTATMTYGHRETDEDIIEHLLRLRALQDETGGFYAFIPWSFKPGTSPLSRLVPEAAPASRYVRIIALSRIVLDNFPHIQASWFSEGWRAGQLALHAGADDFGGLLLEENVLFQANHALATTLDGVLRTITEAEFLPVQRTTLYHRIRAHSWLDENNEAPMIMRREGAGTHANSPMPAPQAN